MTGNTATTEEIRSLIPHAGGMCLLERVLDWSAARIVLATTTHRAADNPLRRNGQLGVVHLCEFGAQAMAVHGGLLARADGLRAAPGLLVSVRNVSFEVQRLDDLPGELTITAERLLGDAGSWQYAFTVHHGEHLLGAGRAAVLAVRERQA